MNSRLLLGFSPCPNDTFIFDALVHGKIDTEGLEFDYILDDVESLNKKVFSDKLDIAKLSYHAYAYASKNYALLTSGSALGKGCGPILISKKDYELSQVDKLSIAIPGKHTTANLLLSFAAPNAKNKIETIFSAIEDKVLSEEVDAGLIIHENRFTYLDKGLKQIADMGVYWEKMTNLPIPLGGIAVKRFIDKKIQLKINRVLRKSIEFAFSNTNSGIEFIKSNAREMSEDVIFKHINLYVNNYSVDLGDDGRNAIVSLFDKTQKLNLIPKFEVNDIFI